MRKDFEQLVKAHPDWDEETLFDEGVVEADEEEEARAIIRQARGGDGAPRLPHTKHQSGHPANAWNRQPDRPSGRGGKEPEFSKEWLTAPYRFVALNETIMPPEPDVLDAWRDGNLHSKPLNGGLSGTLDIDIIFDGPMLIGEAEGDIDAPLKVGGDYVIPGSTLRGLMRSTMEIAANARLSQTNLHRRYGIRDFEHKLFREEDRNKVMGGWLRPWKEGDATLDGKNPDYVIEPCNFHLVKIRDIAPESNGKGYFHLDWLKKPLLKRYAAMGMMAGKQVDFTQTRQFSPHHLPGPLSGVRPDKNGHIEGVYVFSDTSPTLKGITAEKLDAQERQASKGNQKKTECVFETRPSGPALPVARHVWENFIANNSRPSRHTPKPVGNWASLQPTFMPGGSALAQGVRIPVFWVEGSKQDIADFGLVRVFKRAHSYNVADVLHRTGNGCHRLDLDAFSPDFVEALFGFVHEPEEIGQSEAKDHVDRHLKGRLSVGFATLDNATPAKAGEGVQSVMSAPQPSFAPFYLAGTQNKDWSESTARLAGRKRYPARDADGKAVRRWLENHQGNGKADTLSTLQFLEPSGSTPLCFKAQIRLHNLTLAELGSVLWCLTFGGDPTKRHMIGRAKTAGAGQAQITITDMRVDTNDGAAAPDSDTLLQAFKVHMNTSVPGWPMTAPVKDLLATATPNHGASLKLDYLPLRGHRDLRKAVYNKDGSRRVNIDLPRLLPP